MQWKGREIARVVIIQELDKSMECLVKENTNLDAFKRLTLMFCFIMCRSVYLMRFAFNVLLVNIWQYQFMGERRLPLQPAYLMFTNENVHAYCLSLWESFTHLSSYTCSV